MRIEKIDNGFLLIYSANGDLLGRLITSYFPSIEDVYQFLRNYFND